MRYYLWCMLFISVPALGQAYQTCDVIKWKSEPYSQSAHIVRNHIVYSIRVGSVDYQVARRNATVEMSAGEQVQCRLDKGYMYVRNIKGKENKFGLVAEEQAPQD